MSELLQKVFNEVSKLTDAQQDEFARLMLDLLEDDAKWQQSFDASQDVLGSLANKAINDYEQELTQELNPDEL